MRNFYKVKRGTRYALFFTLILCAEGLRERGIISAAEPPQATALPDSDLPGAFTTGTLEKKLAAVVTKHCAQCHGAEDDAEGGIALVGLQGTELAKRPELVKNLIGVLDRGEMPPDGEPPLDEPIRSSLVKSLREVFHESLSSRQRYGPSPLRRMNRFQYNNAVTDLFDLKCVVFTLPERTMREHQGYFRPETGKMADTVRVGNRPLGKSQMIEPRLAGVAAFPQDLRAEHGYDTQGDHLSLSPLLMEAFLHLGASITQSPDFTPKNVGIWKSFFAPPNESADINQEVQHRLKVFLSRAFRRPVDEETVTRYAIYVKRKIETGSDFTEAMQGVAAAVISSPRFLYLYDTAAEGNGSEPLDDFGIVSRLSFFLWGSLPDDHLLELAAEGRLHQPEILQQEVDRMFHDRKLKRFCDSFPAQWLQLDRLISSIPNRERFPQFYFSKYRDSMHMMLEPLLVFETVLIENQSILQFIDSDFTYRSGLLEEAYGPLKSGTEQSAKLPKGEVAALTFRRVPVTDRRVGGVITNAAVMTMTSGPERTQPITRGAWVASVIFNSPPQPPPADVPPLEELTASTEQLTLREQLSLHRQRADCKGCHEKIDPLGFALENFNPVGSWRTKYQNGRDIDTAGVLFRRHEFTDVVGFKDAMLAERDRFTKGFSGHLLSFALGRELDSSDEIALDQITAASKADDYRIQTLIREVILSDPFLNKTNPAKAPVDN
ncbi:DUF1592 domain-containing protein [Planctomicrobium sp.]|nr:DUF1588 domain-containing protein [Planctomicrobium sp.]MDB4733177.1 DUF1592 domain-containing protein [Planctomicrobium sp.]